MKDELTWKQQMNKVREAEAKAAARRKKENDKYAKSNKWD